jgi:hypothetical protein
MSISLRFAERSPKQPLSERLIAVHMAPLRQAAYGELAISVHRTGSISLPERRLEEFFTMRPVRDHSITDKL